MKILDTNIVLRYLLKDHPQLSPRAAEIIEQQEVVLLVEIACEVVYVLQKVYHVSRSEIHTKLTGLLQSHLIHVEKPEVFKETLKIYATNNLDIVDAFLCAYRLVEDAEVATFDEKLQKCLERK